MYKFVLLLCLTAVGASGKQENELPSEVSGSIILVKSKQPAALNYNSETTATAVIGLTEMTMKTMKSATAATTMATMTKEWEKRDDQSLDRSIGVTTGATNASIFGQRIDTQERTIATENKQMLEPLHIEKKALEGAGLLEKWIVQEGNRTCIVVEMTVHLKISYTTVANKKASIILDLPGLRESTSSGHCGENVQNITIVWGSDITLMMQFGKNESNGRYGLDRLEVTLSAENLPDWNSNGTAKLAYTATTAKGRLFSTESKKSYRCEKTQSIHLNSTETGMEMEGQFTVTELQLEAYKPGNSSEFDLAEDCAFDTPDVVPIAVGCALAGLVLVVLMAYLVARRRNQAHGYYSM